MKAATALVGALAPEAREFYVDSIRTLNRARIPFLVGGAYALKHYAGIERHTKDFDVFVRPTQARPALGALAKAGCRVELTFPHWLGKAYRREDFVDVIFSSGNGVAEVDDLWFENSVESELWGVPVRLCPAEEIIWSKSFVQERERFDGADIHHILRTRGQELDWVRLLNRYGSNWRVLLGHLVNFGFVYPGERHRVPAWVMTELASRLAEETSSRSLPLKVCQGTLLSRQQYLVDVDCWGYEDARKIPRGNMSRKDIALWTDDIATALPQPVKQ